MGINAWAEVIVGFVVDDDDFIETESNKPTEGFLALVKYFGWELDGEDDLEDWREFFDEDSVEIDGETIIGVNLASVECLREPEYADIELDDITEAFKEAKKMRKLLKSNSNISMYIKGMCG